MGWRNRPEFQDYWPDGIDYTMFIDEDGTSKMNYIVDKINKGIDVALDDRWFTVTGCVLKNSDYEGYKRKMLDIKYKYWEEGKSLYKGKLKRVCWHSHEIRTHDGPFNLEPPIYDSFTKDLTSFLSGLPVKLFSASINKYDHYLKYAQNAFNPYDLCLAFIMERFVKYFLSAESTAYIILEARNKKDDKALLNYIKGVIDHGTKYVNKTLFKKIKGVYFNPKWCKTCDKSYWGLECADLFSYPIYQFVKYSKESEAFSITERKIHGYPNISGCGLKIFPVSYDH